MPILGNDILTYNLLSLGGILGFGLGSTLFIRRFVPHLWCAAFGGMLAMLSAPVLLRSQGYLDSLPLAFVPLFLAFWVRFLDRPRGRYLLASGATFVLTCTATAPYGVLVSVPALLYFVTCLVAAWRSGSRTWLRSRLPWLLSWTALVFVFHACASRLGLISPAAGPLSSLVPPTASGVPFWSYFLPTSLHRLIAITPVDFYHHAGLEPQLAEKASYLGVVTLLLLHQVIVRKTRVPRTWFLWSTLALVVLLSCGDRWQLWSWTVTLPASWLRRGVDVFRLVELPSQFNLLAALLASTLAAAALAGLLARFKLTRRRVALFTSLTLLALFDLSPAPFQSVRLPAVPPPFARLLQRDPTAPLLEIPQLGSNPASTFAVTDLWRSRAARRLTRISATSPPRQADRLALLSSPLQLDLLTRPDYLTGQSPTSCGPVSATTFDDYLWLYAHTQSTRFLVLQKWLLNNQERAASLAALPAACPCAGRGRSHGRHLRRRSPARAHPSRRRLRRRLAPGSTPASPRVLTSEGSLRVYVPDSRWRVQIAISARSLRHPRSVRLVSAGKELTRWVVLPGNDETLTSPPLALTPGIHDIRVIADLPVPGSGPEPTRIAGRIPVRISVGTIALSGHLVGSEDGNEPPSSRVAAADRVRQ